MKNQRNFQKLLNERTSIKRSITAILLLLVVISTYGQAVKVVRHTDLGNNVMFNTGYSTTVWEVAMIGFRALGADIDENGSGDPY